MEIILGTMMLMAMLLIFSIFSLKAPKGQEAMSGLASAAIATFLVEAIHLYITGDFLDIAFLGEVGKVSGSMGGVAAVALTMIQMKVNPVLAVSAGVAVGGAGILPGFIAGYILGLVTPHIERRIPAGMNVIFGALLVAPLARIIALSSGPMVDSTLSSIGQMISVAALQSPLFMGIILGGLMKVMCTSPLSSMALTAMLGLTGLPMGIAAIATFGGAFTNGIVFSKLKLGDRGQSLAIMLEPLTQADIVSANAIPIYLSNFLGGALAGLSAAYFGIVNHAPGTASPIPGLIAPFAFNSPLTVFLSLVFAMAGGILAGIIGAKTFRNYQPRIGKKEGKESNNPMEASAV